MSQRAIRGDVFAPDDRVAQQQHLVLVHDLANSTTIEPVIFAKLIRQPVVRTSLEIFATLPNPRRQQKHKRHDEQRSGPLAGVEPKLVDAEWNLFAHRTGRSSLRRWS